MRLRKVFVPDSLGPEKVPPVIGITVRVPCGPVPTSRACPSVQLSEYRYVNPGAVGVAARADAERHNRVVRTLFKASILARGPSRAVYVTI